MLNIILILSVLGTSTLSGVFAMGGGTVLLAVLVNILPIKLAMIYHGFIQFFSNLFRCWLSWRSLVPHIIVYYLIGTLLSSYFLMKLVYNPNKGVILVILGALIFVGPYLKWININITNPFGAAICGVLVVWLNTLVGVSGPLLNLFFIKSSLNRHQIIATKSLTQTSAHIIKILFYTGVFQSSSQNINVFTDHPILILLAGLTFFGGWFGKKIVSKISDKDFKTYGSLLISVFGFIFVAQGLYLLILK